MQVEPGGHRPANGAPPSHLRIIAYLYLASVPFEIDIVLAGRSLTFWIGALLAGAVGLNLAFSPRWAAGIDRHVTIPVLSVVVLAWLSVVWSIDTGRTVHAATVLTFVALSSLAAALAISGTFRTAVMALLAGTSIMSVRVLAADRDIDGRADTVSNANDIAVLLALAVVFLVSQLLRPSTDGRMRSVCLVAALVHLGALVATGSRSGVLALGISVIALVIVQMVRLRFGLLILSAGLVSFLASLTVTIGVDVPQRVLDIPGAIQGGSLNAREHFWDAALAGIPSAVGTGFGTTPAFMLQAVGIPAVMHSVYLGLALELGLLGIAVWSWMFGRLLIAARRSPWTQELFLMGVVVAVMATTLTLEARRPLWVYIALLASVAIRKGWLMRIESPVVRGPVP